MTQAKQTGKVIEAAIPLIVLRLFGIGAIAAFGLSVIAPDLFGEANQIVQQVVTASTTPQTLEGEPQFSEDFKKTLKKGDQVAGFTVTSPFDPQRKHPVTGQIRPHRGVDLNTPVGTPMYVIGALGEKIAVECWWDDNGGGWVVTYTSKKLGYEFQYLHLDSCKSGEYTAGDKVGESGDTGIGTGAHSHIEQSFIGKDRFDPYGGFVEIALTGEIPDFGMQTKVVEQPQAAQPSTTKSSGRSHPIIRPNPNAKPGAEGNLHENVFGQALSSFKMPANGNKFQYELSEWYNGEIITLKRARSGDGDKFIIPIRAFTIAHRGFNAAIHTGVDFEAPLGSDMVAIADGEVTKVGWDEWGLGYAIKVQHADGYESIYGHCLDIFVQEGDRVRQGEVIGLVGSSGFSSAPHVHLEVKKNGEAVDFAPYINLEAIKHPNWDKHMKDLEKAMESYENAN